MTSLLVLSSLVHPVTILRKRISEAARRVMSLFVVTHVSLPYSSDGLATALQNFIWVSVRVFFKCFLIVPHIPWNLFILFYNSKCLFYSIILYSIILNVSIILI